MRWVNQNGMNKEAGILAPELYQIRFICTKRGGSEKFLEGDRFMPLCQLCRVISDPVVIASGWISGSGIRACRSSFEFLNVAA